MGYLEITGKFISELLFPSGCSLCGTMLVKSAETGYGLCGECAKTIQMEKGERCLFCGRPLISEKKICLSCREKTEETNIENKSNTSIDRIFSIYPYTGRYRKLIWAFKYGKSGGTASFMADKIIEAIKLLDIPSFTLVPVPPRPGKIWKTGWDQIDFLSGVLERKTNFPVSRCLIRLAHDTQKKLNKEERITNLQGKICFSAPQTKNKKAPPLCILFDDVITTGSTMNVCAGELKKAGAEKVFGICLAYD